MRDCFHLIGFHFMTMSCKYKIHFFQWHGLSREEQAKYYDQARKERQLHMQMYPGWSARDNYAQSKKKKRKREAESSK